MNTDRAGIFRDPQIVDAGGLAGQTREIREAGRRDDDGRYAETLRFDRRPRRGR
ncbi:MAG TPA: hypothetical protein VED01_24235 [Burkholderiales bacterium]|nr:hypothetical protein [Burkholderiales bacterium]